MRRGRDVGSFPGKSSCATCHNTCAGMLQWTRATLHAVTINTSKEPSIVQTIKRGIFNDRRVLKFRTLK